MFFMNYKISPELEEKVSLLIERTDNTLLKALGIEFSEITKNKVVASMPVDDRTRQPFGLLHGGASVALAESLASVAAWLNCDEKKFAVVGIEINANHIRAKREGVVSGTATPLHRGRKTHVWEIRIVDEEDNLICISRCTLGVIPLDLSSV